MVEYRELGRSGIRVSAIGIGTYEKGMNHKLSLDYYVVDS